MAHFFHANEIAKMAVTIEQKGQKFYQQAARSAKTSSVKELFVYLAEEESKHEAIFTALMESLGTVELPAWSSQEEYAQYIDALIESHTLFVGEGPEKLVADAADEREVIRLAMSFEKDTVLFFMEMENLVPDADKPAVHQCVEEERLHIRRLAEMLAGK